MVCNAAYTHSFAPCSVVHPRVVIRVHSSLLVHKSSRFTSLSLGGVRSVANRIVMLDCNTRTKIEHDKLHMFAEHVVCPRRRVGRPTSGDQVFPSLESSYRCTEHRLALHLAIVGVTLLFLTWPLSLTDWSFVLPLRVAKLTRRNFNVLRFHQTNTFDTWEIYI